MSKITAHATGSPTNKSNGDTQLKPDYVGFARRLSRGPLSDGTKKDQRVCLGACSIFLLGWYNLVEIRSLPRMGEIFSASTSVLTWLAFILMAYYFVRFIGEAAIDVGLFRIECESDYEKAQTAIRAEAAAFARRQDAWWTACESAKRKIEANRTFGENQVARIAEIRSRYEPKRIDLMTQYQVLKEEFDSIPVELHDARQPILESHTRVTEQLRQLASQLDSLIEPIAAETCPHPEIDEEADEILDSALTQFKFENTEKFISVMRLGRTRGRITGFFDIGVPVCLTAYAVACGIISLTKFIK